MSDTSPVFTTTDALLLYSIVYCRRHRYRPTLGQIFLLTDAFDRSYPTALELEDGLSRLIVGGYVERLDEEFAPTEVGIRAVKLVEKQRKPKLRFFEQIRSLADSLSISCYGRASEQPVPKQLTVTDAQVTTAVVEAHALFDNLKWGWSASRMLGARRRRSR